jgi:predicted PurR-regulated permease PerM
LNISTHLAHASRTVSVLFAMVILLAMVLNPIIASLERRGIKRGLAVLLFAMIFVGVLALVFWLLIPPLLEQLNELIRRTPEYIGIDYKRKQKRSASVIRIFKMPCLTPRKF